MKKIYLFEYQPDMVRYVLRKSNGSFRKGVMSKVIAEHLGLSPCDPPNKDFSDYRLSGWNNGTQYFFETRSNG